MDLAILPVPDNRQLDSAGSFYPAQAGRCKTHHAHGCHDHTSPASKYMIRTSYSTFFILVILFQQCILTPWRPDFVLSLPSWIGVAWIGGYLRYKRSRLSSHISGSLGSVQVSMASKLALFRCLGVWDLSWATRKESIISGVQRHLVGWTCICQ